MNILVIHRKNHDLNSMHANNMNTSKLKLDANYY